MRALGFCLPRTPVLPALILPTPQSHQRTLRHVTAQPASGYLILGRGWSFDERHNKDAERFCG